MALLSLPVPLVISESRYQRSTASGLGGRGTLLSRLDGGLRDCSGGEGLLLKETAAVRRGGISDADVVATSN